jgi:hypothetical protein
MDKEASLTIEAPEKYGYLLGSRVAHYIQKKPNKNTKNPQWMAYSLDPW